LTVEHSEQMGKGLIGLRLVEGEGSFLGQGLVVAGIVADPAKDAGFQINDLVTQINEFPLKHMSDMPAMLGSVEPGSKLKFKISRFGKEMELSLTVGHKPSLMEKLKGENKSDTADTKVTVERPITPPRSHSHDKDSKKPKPQTLPEGFVNPKVKKEKSKKAKDANKGALPTGYVNPKVKHHKDVTVALDRSVASVEPERKDKERGGGSGGFLASLMPGSFRGKGHARSASAQPAQAEPPPSASPSATSGDRPKPPPRRKSLIDKVKENQAQKESKNNSNTKPDDQPKRPRTPPR